MLALIINVIQVGEKSSVLFVPLLQHGGPGKILAVGASCT